MLSQSSHSLACVPVMMEVQIPKLDELSDHRVVLHLAAIGLQQQVKGNVQAVAQEQICLSASPR